MGRNWAISIGIDQYDYLQRLNYAQRDAAAMRDYFLNEAGFEKVYYFANDAPDIEMDYGPPFKPLPTFTKLDRFLDIRFEQSFLEAGDNFWFFFAGHGKRHHERDYLLPSDVNPRNIERTAIPITHITERLRRCGTDNVILLLDACRNEGYRDGEGIGTEKQKGVVTFFSCSPSEYSYEIDELQHGSFTYTLLQGLRIQGEGNCAIVERLDQHLRYQVPELNRRYRKPEQTPSTNAEPITKRHLILLPQLEALSRNSRSIQPVPAPPIFPPTPSISDFQFQVITVNDWGQEASRRPGKAQYLIEDIGNGVQLEMVSIPGGTFQMGSPAGEGDNDEQPQHPVSIKPFLMGKYAITQAQWKAVASLPKVDRDLEPVPYSFKGDNRPVEEVAWHDAIEFCARLSRKTGQKYRLPSEAEWEYACRAGTTTPFHFGGTITTGLANYRGIEWEYSGKIYPGSYGAGPEGTYREQTTEVGSFSPNAFGLYDMHGNVWEWCLDHWHDNYQGAPTDGSAWIKGGDSCLRLLRGGSWYINPRNCRSASRSRNDPTHKDLYIGFRVCSLAPELVDGNPSGESKKSPEPLQ